MLKVFKSGTGKTGARAEIVTAKTDDGRYTGTYTVRSESLSISEPSRKAYETEKECIIAMVKKAGNFLREHGGSGKTPEERDNLEKMKKQLGEYYAGFFQMDLFGGGK